MYCLSNKQIDFILDDISARGIGLVSLQQNLLDHICCLIENNLEADGDFESFYQNTISTFFKTELKEIEEETINLLIHKNYYIMKKIMLISGTLSALILSQGILFKFMHWQGALALILLGIVLLSFVFLPLLFTLKIKEKKNVRDKIIIAIGTAASMMISIGILFKIMHWPGANVILGATLAIMLLLFLPIYFFTGIRNPETKVNTIVSSILIVTGSGLLLTLVRSPAGTQREYAMHTGNFWNNEQLLKNEQKLTAALLISKGADPSLHSNAVEIINICENLKAFLLERETGNATLSDDFNSKRQLISENRFSNHLTGNEHLKLDALRNKINAYNNDLPTAANPIEIKYTLLDNQADKKVYEALNDLVHIEMTLLQNQNLSTLIK